MRYNAFKDLFRAESFNYLLLTNRFPADGPTYLPYPT